ncbi:UDP-N-acetylglucosamine 1-carboxyvinyltransferase [Thermoproteota archaeon]
MAGNNVVNRNITDLGNFLSKAGAQINGLGTSVITINGVPKLTNTTYSIIPDRVEAATLLIAGAITKSEITVDNIIPSHLESLLEKLKECGAKLTIADHSITIQSNGSIKSVSLDTQPFPGFPTDMQAQMMSLLCLAQGNSIIKESIFENRYMHAIELTRMGANIAIDSRHAFITGVPKLSGAEVKITDLRAGAALILAGLAAEGKTTVYGLKHLRRGYDNLPQKLIALGAKIYE